MSALAPGFDPLIAEAKLRMRRRRVMLAVLALLAVATVLTLILRPSTPPGATRVTSHSSTEKTLAHIKVPVDAAERHYRAKIGHIVSSDSVFAPTAPELRSEVIAAVHGTGATVLRVHVWPRSLAVEVVLATGPNPAEYLAHRLRRLVNLVAHGYPYVKVVNASGSRIFEWYYLPREGIVGVPPRLQRCSPVTASWSFLNPPPCPAK